MWYQTTLLAGLLSTLQVRWAELAMRWAGRAVTLGPSVERDRHFSEMEFQQLYSIFKLSILVANGFIINGNQANQLFLETLKLNYISSRTYTEPPE